MQLSNSLIPLFVLAPLLACSSTDDSPRISTLPTEPAYETVDCPPWPRSKLFPLVGLFLGPDPGPCSTSQDGETRLFDYNTAGVLARLVSTDNTDLTEYFYDQGLLLSETRTQLGGVTSTKYEYSDEHIKTQTAQPDGSQAGYEYTLDDRGFVQSAQLLNPVSSVSVPTHYNYEYRNCKLHWRIAYDKNESVNLSATAEYLYDDAGRVIERKSDLTDELFDYSCW